MILYTNGLNIPIWETLVRTTVSENFFYWKLSLKLIPGKNDITFSLSTAFQGKITINASIFLWDDSSKIVISDLDGTVTKSDMLGHFFPLIGKEWHHKNVSKLYQKIHNNGYQIIYMSMRNVGYSNLTKRQLSTLVLDGNKLPPGPLVLCPLSLFNTIQMYYFTTIYIH